MLNTEAVKIILVDTKGFGFGDAPRLAGVPIIELVYLPNLGKKADDIFELIPRPSICFYELW
jgi:hypothetical protein